jgi:hypothetical protein
MKKLLLLIIISMMFVFSASAECEIKFHTFKGYEVPTKETSFESTIEFYEDRGYVYVKEFDNGGIINHLMTKSEDEEIYFAWHELEGLWMVLFSSTADGAANEYETIAKEILFDPDYSIMRYPNVAFWHGLSDFEFSSAELMVWMRLMYDSVDDSNPDLIVKIYTENFSKFKGHF